MDLAAEGTNDYVRFFKFCNKYDIDELAATAKESFEDFIEQEAYDIKADYIAALVAMIYEGSPVLDLMYRCHITMLTHDEHEYYSSKDSKREERRVLLSIFLCHLRNRMIELRPEL